MDVFGKRHRLVFAMLVLFVPLLTGAEGKGCQAPGDGGPGGGGTAGGGPGGGEPGACFRTGCSGQVCADEDVVTTCEYREEYGCYGEYSVCERGASGECGWRQTPELEACLEDRGGDPVDPAPCVVTGCSGQVCADEDVITDCEYREEYACYAEHGTCERDASGACGWRQTPELEACIEDKGKDNSAPPVDPAPCVVTGCSGQVCADDDVVTTCEYREEYACYGEHGVCERDASGACGWRQTPELEACLEDKGTDTGAPPVVPAPCVVTGCSGQVCADEHVATTCEYREEYACYGEHSVCERDASGACGWRQTPELQACIGEASGGRTP
ncbi:hypothetical protein [Sorangium sp. So ce854]|uniref:hypothetical protein n=1 Tax=Sorangium sp. So ce854 TaxID=3133322 RepID=UPI003F601CEE